ncbi:MAG: hypothetical protein J5894_02235 [Clostridia bacterium]|nr:hypothetical protein [Clostridia bacterium]
MKITKENKTKASLFAKILLNIGLTEETGTYIMTLFPNEATMDKMVEYISNNPQATEKEIIEEAERISET